MSAPRALRNLSADAAPNDRVSAALTANGIANPYRHATQPKTFEELRARCGKHGSDAVEAVKWGCVSAWCMKQDPCPSEWMRAAGLLSGAANGRIMGKPSPMADMNSPGRRAIGRSAFGALQAWKADGCPGLDRSLRITHQLVFNIERIKAEEAEAQQTKEEEAR